MYVVQLTEANVDDLLALAKLVHNERYSHLPYDREIVRANALFVANCVSTMCAYIAYTHKHGPVGFITGEIRPYTFNSEKFVEQGVWFVRREQRGSIAAAMLKDELETWAVRRGAREVFMALISTRDDENETVDDMFNKAGYSRVGAFYKKEL